MSDLKLEATRGIDRSYKALASSISNEKIKEVAGFFVQNMDRVLALSDFHIGAFNYIWARLRDNQQLSTRQVGKGIPGGPGAIPGGPGFLPPTDAQRFSDVIEALIQGGFLGSREQVDEGTRAILGALITGAWTAFETMAGDLWEEAVNANPAAILSELTKLEFEAGHQVERIRLPLSVDEFKKANYSLMGQLGTIIRAPKTTWSIDVL